MNPKSCWRRCRRSCCPELLSELVIDIGRGPTAGNAQLEGEGTGEDGGQEDRILANDGPKKREVQG